MRIATVGQKTAMNFIGVLSLKTGDGSGTHRDGLIVAEITGRGNAFGRSAAVHHPSCSPAAKAPDSARCRRRCCAIVAAPNTHLKGLLHVRDRAPPATPGRRRTRV